MAGWTACHQLKIRREALKKETTRLRESAWRSTTLSALEKEIPT